MELTDIHNRRANIETVAKRCQENNYPLLVWPEDKQLLRLADLPKIEGHVNIPPAWKRIELVRGYDVRDNDDLQEVIVLDRAYCQTSHSHVLGYRRVLEFKVVS